ncbi:hypothetical protein D3C84_236260 [compost metagenome]
MARHHQAHQEGRDQEVEQGGDEEREELAEGHLARLPHHQGGDVAKGAEGAAGIGRHHYVDAGEVDEAAIPPRHLEHHAAHQERRGHVVRHRRDEEGQDTREPEQGAQAITRAHQGGAQGIEQPPLLHGVDIGHGHQQEQQQLGIFQQVVTKSVVGQGAEPLLGIDDANHYPDDAGRDQHRLGLAQLQGLLGHHQPIGEHEEDEGEPAGPAVGQGDGAAVGEAFAGKQTEPEQGDEAQGSRHECSSLENHLALMLAADIKINCIYIRLFGITARGEERCKPGWKRDK